MVKDAVSGFALDYDIKWTEELNTYIKNFNVPVSDKYNTTIENMRSLPMAPKTT
jgi:hypothetical protein